MNSTDRLATVRHSALDPGINMDAKPSAKMFLQIKYAQPTALAHLNDTALSQQDIVGCQMTRTSQKQPEEYDRGIHLVLKIP